MPRVTFDLPSTRDLHSLIARLVENTTTTWDERFAELEAFALEHGTAHPPSKNKRLTTWCEYQRKAYRRGMLLPDRAAALRSLPGWTWDAEMRAWIEQWKEIRATIPPGGRLDVENPETMTRPLQTSSGRNRATTIGRWCAHQRVLARRGDLDAARRNYLKEMPGWTYHALSDVDAACLDLLAEYVAWKGHANPPADYVDDDLPIGQWLTTVRRAKVLGTLSQALQDELEVTTPSAGSPGKLRWETRETQWQVGLEVLRQYAAREGRCRMPENHTEIFEGIQYPLYVWCRRQRHDHRYDNLEPARAAALEAVPGWLWEIQPTPRIGIAHFRTQAADRAICLRIAHVFQRIHRLHAEVPFGTARKIELVAQLLSDQREHGIVFGLGQVAHDDLGRIDAPTGRARDDHGDLATTTERDHLDLDAEGIAAVQHQVVAATELFGQGRRRHEGRFGLDLQQRRNLLQPIAQGLDLELAELALKRVQLPVGVRYADLVGIEQRQPADAAARQGFRNPRADAADTDDGNMLILQSCNGATAVEAVDAGKSGDVVHGVGAA